MSKNLILLFVFISVSTFAQKPNTIYDSVLAKKLGADEYGMKKYVFCLLKTGPVTETNKAKKDSLFAGHMKNMDVLIKDGKLVMAGPFMKNDRQYRGLFIFNVGTIAEAEKLTQTDPAIKSGLLLAELTEWYGSASLLETPELHKKVQKKDF